MKRIAFLFLTIFIFSLTACAQQPALPTEPALTEMAETIMSTEPETTAPPETTEETEPAETEPPVIPFAISKLNGENGVEITAENLYMKVTNGRDLEITIDGITVQEEYLIHPYETENGTSEYEWSIRLLGMQKEFLVSSFSSVSYKDPEGMWEQYSELPFLVYCKEHGVMPLAEEIPMKFEDMSHYLYAQDAYGYLQPVAFDNRVKYTENSITWYVSIPWSYSLDVNQMDKIEVHIHNSGEYTGRIYVLDSQ